MRCLAPVNISVRHLLPLAHPTNSAEKLLALGTIEAFRRNVLQALNRYARFDGEGIYG